jgi:hypothetical protein
MNIRTRGVQAGGTIVFQIGESREKGYFLVGMTLEKKEIAQRGLLNQDGKIYNSLSMNYLRMG